MDHLRHVYYLHMKALKCCLFLLSILVRSISHERELQRLCRMVLRSKVLLSIRRHASNCSVFVFESAYHGEKKRPRPRSHSVFPGALRWAERHKCTPSSTEQRKGLSPRLMLAASHCVVCLAQWQREQIWSMGLAGYCKSWDQSCFSAGV